MKELIVYRLEGRDGRLSFHLGERGVGLEETSVHLHSDRLFSALCLAWRSLGENLEELLNAFPRIRFSSDLRDASPIEPPFLITSVYPFYRDVYFFPRPLLPAAGFTGGMDPVIGKGLKKVQYISKKLFEAWIAAQPIDRFFLNSQNEKPSLRGDLSLQAGKAWLTDEEAQKSYPADGSLWSLELQPRVTVGRSDNRSVVYASGRVHFVPEAGLYFLVQYNQPGWRTRVESALEYLAEEGIGGERSNGNGQFQLAGGDPFSLNEPGDPDGFLSLSLYWPSQAEVVAGGLEGARYMLMNQRGWIASPEGMGIRRPNVRMLAEGSVFTRKPFGRLVDLTPLGEEGKPLLAHPVWRYGLAFPARCVLAGGTSHVP